MNSILPDGSKKAMETERYGDDRERQDALNRRLPFAIKGSGIADAA